VVAAMNPCPCGYAGDTKRICRCTLDQVQRYRTRISGPLLDRFDLHVQLSPVPITALRQEAHGETSAAIRARVVAARARALVRKARTPSGALDVPLPSLDPTARQLLYACTERFSLSMRAFHKLLRVARTIADLEASDAILTQHVAEAVQYRLFDREADPQPTAAELDS
jgi:magnesium chelatase family protein